MSATPPVRRDAAAPTRIRAATTLAVWSAALAAGHSADAAIDALSGMPHGARADDAALSQRWGLPGPGQPHSGHADLLAFVRRGGPAALVLPVPGDLRGLPTGGEITLPALDAGAVVVLPAHGVGLIPSDGHWRAYPCGAAHPVLAEQDARALVDGALREATVALTRADVARGSGHSPSELRRLILADEVPLPEGTPSVASALLAQSITLRAVLQLAYAHETAAATARTLTLVDEALAPLAAAVRESRRTAVALAVAGLHPDLESDRDGAAPRRVIRRTAG